MARLQQMAMELQSEYIDYVQICLEVGNLPMPYLTWLKRTLERDSAIKRDEELKTEGGDND